MSAPAISKLMTTEELLAMPDDGMDRYLIDGQLWEKPMTRRNRRHSRTMTNLAAFLAQWLARQPMPRGEILTGDAAFRLRPNPDTTVGIDLAYISPQLAAQTPDDTFLIDGAPVLAVEILSPSDQHEEIVNKVQGYLNRGVALVWVVDPDFRLVQVHRPGAVPETVNVLQELSGDPELPGFRVAVAEVFRQ
ncbi:MAG: Uma2 family endonuclease [Gemmataceae bacterium]|nr:Uma2 family endonuclease [Gemmataceae bacterium]